VIFTADLPAIASRSGEAGGGAEHTRRQTIAQSSKPIDPEAHDGLKAQRENSGCKAYGCWEAWMPGCKKAQVWIISAGSGLLSTTFIWKVVEQIKPSNPVNPV
jgi:hypothetical protein